MCMTNVLRPRLKAPTEEDDLFHILVAEIKNARLPSAAEN